MLLQITRFVVDMYSGILGTGHSTKIDSLVTKEIAGVLAQEISLSENLL